MLVNQCLMWAALFPIVWGAETLALIEKYKGVREERKTRKPCELDTLSQTSYWDERAMVGLVLLQQRQLL